MNGISLALLITALTLSTVSAYYSIVGLAAIFAASFWPVLILATTLEAGKLVMVSWLYRNWDHTPWPIRTYMTVAVIMLMLITSLGIFGFLSKAHSEDQVQAQQIQLQVTQIVNQIDVRQQQLSQSREVVEQLNRSINIQLDANRPQQALANRRQQTAERERVQARMDQLQAEILQLSEQKSQLLSVRNVQESKLGPVRYVVQIVNPDADPQAAVKWIILVLVLVCDPLAVCMLMAANQKAIMPGAHVGHVPVMMPPSPIRWHATDNVLQIQDDVGVWHNIKDQASTPTVMDQVKLVEQAVHELVKHRPIFDLGPHDLRDSPIMHHMGQARSDAGSDAISPEKLQKLIEHTLETWMNKTLTVTYSADQTEIEKIVEKVIHKMSPATTTMSTTPDEPPTEPATPQPEPTEPSIPTPATEPVSDVTSQRPIYNYFGEERIRGGKKHNITT